MTVKQAQAEALHVSLQRKVVVPKIWDLVLDPDLEVAKLPVGGRGYACKCTQHSRCVGWKAVDHQSDVEHCSSFQVLASYLTVNCSVCSSGWTLIKR